MTKRDHNWRWSRFNVSGIDCAGCAGKLRRHLLKLPSVRDVDVDIDTGSLQVVHSAADKEIAATIDSAGYRVLARPHDPHKVFVTRSAIAAGSLSLTAIAFILGSIPLWSTITLAVAIAIAGIPVAVSAWPAVIRLRADMHLLITIAAGGAIIIGHPWEAALLVGLFASGQALQAWAGIRSQTELELLWRDLPDTAIVRRDSEIEIQTSAIVPGDTIILKPGSRVPSDGVIISGTALVDMAPISGETKPMTRTEGEELFAGTTVYDGYLELEATSTPFLSTPNRIRELISQARTGRTAIESTIDRFARYYTPVVLVLALLVAVIPPVFGADLSGSIYRALALLVISCPCALVLAGPVTSTAGITAAARQAMILKHATNLEQISSCSVVAFDKTGTITTGKMQITKVKSTSECSSERVLQLAAAVESRSQHPLAQAIIERAGGIPEGLSVTDFSIVPGKGISATVNGDTIFVGSPRLFPTTNITAPSVVCVGTDSELLGVIETSDQIRPGVREMISQLNELGIETMLITGDDDSTARATADKAGIKTVQSELSPEQKLELIEQISSHKSVMMVGDGINDAPALARATVGVSLGGSSVQAALDSADVCIVDDDVSKIGKLIRLSRSARRIMCQSIGISLGFKLVAVAAIIPGWLSLFLAIVADDGALLIVIANGLRLLGTGKGRRNEAVSGQTRANENE